ncbi:MAG TPA: hypothetical protein VI320_16755, partial [Terracidiphilus sp.]
FRSGGRQRRIAKVRSFGLYQFGGAPGNSLWADFEVSLVWPEGGGCEVVLELQLRRALNLQEASPCAFSSSSTSP